MIALLKSLVQVSICYVTASKPQVIPHIETEGSIEIYFRYFFALILTFLTFSVSSCMLSFIKVNNHNQMTLLVYGIPILVGGLSLMFNLWTYIKGAFSLAIIMFRLVAMTKPVELLEGIYTFSAIGRWQ